MKTITTTRIVTKTEKSTFTYWGESDDYPVQIELPMNKKDQKEVAADLECSPKLIAALSLTLQVIIDSVSEDLAEIWERLDRLEGKFNEPN